MVMVTRRGFTIIELMVVIVVVAVLARIVFVAYNGTQARTRDAIRKNDLSSLAKQIQIYAVQNKTWTPACGDTASPLGGYTNVTYGANPTISACLKSFDTTNKQLNDPSGCMAMAGDIANDPAGSACNTDTRSAYKAYNLVASTGRYYLFTRLETVGNVYTAIDAISTTEIPDVTKTAIKALGFNYAQKVR